MTKIAQLEQHGVLSRLTLDYYRADQRTVIAAQGRPGTTCEADSGEARTRSPTFERCG